MHEYVINIWRRRVANIFLAHTHMMENIHSRASLTACTQFNELLFNTAHSLAHTMLPHAHQAQYVFNTRRPRMRQNRDEPGYLAAGYTVVGGVCNNCVFMNNHDVCNLNNVCSRTRARVVKLTAPHSPGAAAQTSTCTLRPTPAIRGVMAFACVFV